MRLRIHPYPPSDPAATKRATHFLRFVQTGAADGYLRYPTAFWGETTDEVEWEGKRAFEVVFAAEVATLSHILSHHSEDVLTIVVMMGERDPPEVDVPEMVYLSRDDMDEVLAERIQRIYDRAHSCSNAEGSTRPRTAAQESNGWRKGTHARRVVGEAGMVGREAHFALPFTTLRDRLSHGQLVPLSKILEHPYAHHLQGHHERVPGTRVKLHISILAQGQEDGGYVDEHYIVGEGDYPLQKQLTLLQDSLESTWVRTGQLRLIRVSFIEYDPAHDTVGDARDPLLHLTREFDLVSPDQTTHSPSLLWYCDCPTEEDYVSLERQMDTARVTGRGTLLDALMRLQVARRVLLEVDAVTVPIGFVPLKLIGSTWARTQYTLTVATVGGRLVEVVEGRSAPLTWKRVWELVRQTQRIGVAGVFEEDLARLAVQWSPFWEYDHLPELTPEEWCRMDRAEREERDLAEDDASTAQYEAEDLFEKVEPVSLPLNTLLPTQPYELEWLEQTDVREVMDFVDPRWPADPAVAARTLRYPDGSRRLVLFSTRRGGARNVTLEREVDVVTSLATGVDLIKRPVASQHDWALVFQKELSVEQLSLGVHERDLGIIEDDYITIIIQLGYLLRVDRVSTRVALYRTWLEPDTDEVRQLSHATLSWLRSGSEYSYFATRYAFAYSDSTRRHRALWTIASESPSSVAPLHVAPDLPLEYLAHSHQRWVVDAFTWLTKLKEEHTAVKGQDGESVLQSMERALRIVGDDRMPRGAEGTLLHVLESLRDMQVGVGVLDVPAMRAAVERMTMDAGRKRTGRDGTPKASKTTQKRRKYQ